MYILHPYPREPFPMLLTFTDIPSPTHILPLILILSPSPAISIGRLLGPRDQLDGCRGAIVRSLRHTTVVQQQVG